MSAPDPTSIPPAPPAPRPSLVVLTGAQFGEVAELPSAGELVLGRGAEAGLVLHDGGVSRRHATVALDAGAARLVDLGSANGTFVAGARVAEAALADGTRFRLGGHAVLQFLAAGGAASADRLATARGALHEPLTGLYNRRHFLDRLAAELSASQRYGRPLSLLLVDLDGFARVNEAHGPDAGDAALRAVAFVLQGAVRREDVVARIGGEEFAVLARDTPLTGARVLAERVRRTVERTPARVGAAAVAITVSVGATVSVGLSRFEPGRTEAQLLAGAERALQRAQQNGRNSVIAVPALGG